MEGVSDNEDEYQKRASYSGISNWTCYCKYYAKHSYSTINCFKDSSRWLG